MPSYTVKDLATEDEMHDVVEFIFHALGQPYAPSNQILFPVFGYSSEDQVRGLIAAKGRLWLEHCKQRASSGWIYVVDDVTQEIVAASRWKCLPGSPFPNGIPEIDLHWWPSGEARKFCEQQLQQVLVPRSIWMHRPHGGAERMIVRHDVRNQGIGTLMMKSINQRLDGMRIEGFIEASELGRPLYEKFGYQVLMKIDFYHPLKRSVIYNRISHDLSLPPWYAMWRPVMGNPKESGRDRPWQSDGT